MRNEHYGIGLEITASIIDCTFEGCCAMICRVGNPRFNVFVVKAALLQNVTYSNGSESEVEWQEKNPSLSAAAASQKG